MTEEKAVGKVSWSDAEKIALLVTMLENKGGPDWKGLSLPPGRTKKACNHVWTKLKSEATKADWYQAGGARADTDDADGDEGAAPSTPASDKKKRGPKADGFTSNKRVKKNDVDVKAEKGL